MLVKHKLCGNNNPNNVGVANSLDNHEFPARMEDNGDGCSTTRECSSEGSTLPDDEQQAEEQEQESDDDIEMIHPIDWNAVNVNLMIPSHKSCLGRNRVFTQ